MFGDVLQEIEESHDAFGGATQTIVTTLPETVEGSLLIGRYFTGSPEAVIDTPGFGRDAELINPTQFDIGLITGKRSPGGDQSLQITGSQAQEAILRFKEIEGPFVEDPFDVSAVSPKTTDVMQSTGTTPETTQAEEFAAALVTQNSTQHPPTVAVDNEFVNLASDEGGDPPGTGATKSIFHADKVLSAVGAVEAEFTGFSPSIHMGGVATYKGGGGAPVLPCDTKVIFCFKDGLLVDATVEHFP